MESIKGVVGKNATGQQINVRFCATAVVRFRCGRCWAPEGLISLIAHRSIRWPATITHGDCPLGVPGGPEQSPAVMVNAQADALGCDGFKGRCSEMSPSDQL